MKATQLKKIQAFDFEKVITKIFDKFEMLKNWKNRQIMKTLQVGKANKQRKTEQILTVKHIFFLFFPKKNVAIFFPKKKHSLILLP